MFDFAEWIVNNLIAGVKNGAFPREWAAVQLGNYYVKGKVSEADISRFDEDTAVPEPVDTADDMEGADGQ